MLPGVPLTQSFFLPLAIAAMFASQGGALLSRLDVVAWLLPPLVVFYAVGLFRSLGVGKFAGLDRRDTTAVCFATVCRNSPLSLAIEPLIELPLVTLISRWIKPAQVLRPEPSLADVSRGHPAQAKPGDRRSLPTSR